MFIALNSHVRPNPSGISGGATGCAGGVAGDGDAEGRPGKIVICKAPGACPRHPLPPSNET